MTTDLITSIPALIFLLFLPGYSIYSALFTKKPLPWPERILTSILLSITLNITTTLILNLALKIPVNLPVLITQNTFFILAGTTAYLLKTKKIPEIYLEYHEYNLEKILRTPTAIILIATSTLLTYSIHQHYEYPLITDEWQHIAQAKQIIYESTIAIKNPYYEKQPTELESGFFEKGFHILLAQIFLITGQDGIKYSTYLPALFAAAAALGIYSFTTKATGNTNIGLLSIIFYTGIKSNISLLGAWFLVPLATSIPFIYAVPSLLAAGLEEKNKNKTLLSALLLLGLALIHPWSAAITFTLTATYFILRKNTIKENKADVILFLTIPLLAFTYIIPVLWQKDLPSTANYFLNKVIIRGLEIPVNQVGDPLFPIMFYGVIPSTLTLVGIYTATKKRGLNLIMISALIPTTTIYLIYQLTGKSLLIPYEREVYYLFLAAAPLSAYGLYTLIDYVNKKIKNNLAAIIISTILIAGTTASLFSSYYDGTKSLHRVMNEQTYKAIKWLSATRGQGNVVLTRPSLSSTVYPISGNHVISVNPAQVGLHEYGLTDNIRFFMENCTGKKEIIKKYDVDYVILSRDDKTDCEFLPWIYIQKGIYIYEVDKTLL